MRTTEFVTQANFVPGVGLTLDTEDMVERDYYRSTEDIVDELVRAGERLERYRAEEYDLDPDSEVIELPVNRSRTFDAAEASMLMESEAARIASKSKAPKPEPEEEPEKEPEKEPAKNVGA